MRLRGHVIAHFPALWLFLGRAGLLSNPPLPLLTGPTSLSCLLELLCLVRITAFSLAKTSMLPGQREAVLINQQ